MARSKAQATIRLGSGLSAMAALTWLLWPAPGWSPEPEPIYVFILAIALWGWREIVNENPHVEDIQKSSHPHDVWLMSEIKKSTDNQKLRPIKEHDFGGSYPESYIAPILKLCDQVSDPQFEFSNAEIQSEYEIFTTSGNAFLDKLGVYGGIISLNTNGENWYSIIPERELHTGQFSTLTNNRVREINDLASKTYNSYVNFYRLARLKLPEAFAS